MSVEIIVTCPHCDSPKLDTDLDGYLSCVDCYWSEVEETFSTEEEDDFIRNMND